MAQNTFLLQEKIQVRFYENKNYHNDTTLAIVAQYMCIALFYKSFIQGLKKFSSGIELYTSETIQNPGISLKTN